MGNKSSWDRIAYSSWQQLTAEGYTAWKHLYFTLVSAIKNIIFSFTSAFSRIVELSIGGNIVFGFSPIPSRLINITTESDIISDFVSTAYRTCKITSEKDIIFNSIPKISRITKIISNGDIALNCASYINRAISLSILKPRFTWNEISTWKRLIDEKYVTWRDLYNSCLVFLTVSNVNIDITYFTQGIMYFKGIPTLRVRQQALSMGDILFKTNVDLWKENWEEPHKTIVSWAEKPHKTTRWEEMIKESNG